MSEKMHLIVHIVELIGIAIALFSLIDHNDKLKVQAECIDALLKSQIALLEKEIKQLRESDLYDR